MVVWDEVADFGGNDGCDGEDDDETA